MRKVDLKFWVSSRFGILGVGVWHGGWIRYVDVKIEFFRKIFEKISGNFAEISGKHVVIRKREIDIARWEINILMNDLRKNNPEIIPNPSVKYLRDVIFYVFLRLFPTPFMYVCMYCMKIIQYNMWCVVTIYWNIKSDIMIRCLKEGFTIRF